MILNSATNNKWLEELGVEELESIIASGKNVSGNGFVGVGRALRRLSSLRQADFFEYCQKKFGLNHNWVRHIFAVLEVADIMDATPGYSSGDLPDMSTARGFVAIRKNPESVLRAWDRAKEMAAGKKVTYKMTKKATDELFPGARRLHGQAKVKHVKQVKQKKPVEKKVSQPEPGDSWKPSGKQKQYILDRKTKKYEYRVDCMVFGIAKLSDEISELMGDMTPSEFAEKYVHDIHAFDKRKLSRAADFISRLHNALRVSHYWADPPEHKEESHG